MTITYRSLSHVISITILIFYRKRPTLPVTKTNKLRLSFFSATDVSSVDLTFNEGSESFMVLTEIGQDKQFI